MRNNNFLMNLERRFAFMEHYEDKEIQKKALETLPRLTLEAKAQERLRTLQHDVKKGIIEDLDISFQEMLLLELLAWFKSSFEWVDSPDCDRCGNETKFSHMSSDPKMLACASKVEMHRCETCSEFTPFFRYTDLGTLLETREGRCGEWASAFTLYCRALNWDTRYVYDETDHVWTEVYSVAQRRWLHCDPCENICDNPLIYECGWGKKLSYIIAFSHEDIQDVTWRYSTDHKKLVENRKLCSEGDLIQTLTQLRENKQKHFSKARKDYLCKRMLMELVELMFEKKATDYEKHGRISGSLAWRQQRGEIGENLNVNESFIWKPTEDELKTGQMIIRYSPTFDRYERMKANDEITGQIEKWEKGTYSYKGVFRKEEKDWKMVYLCRKEGIVEGEIEYRFESGNDQIVIDKVALTVKRSVFENGQIEIQLCGRNKCISLQSDKTYLSTDELEGCSSLMIKATLTGGKGDCAWQHAQLFRQSSNNYKDYPFHMCITFKNK